MFTPSRRVADSIKIALAITIIYAIAYYMDWYKAYWATVSAASVNLLSQGMTLHRGVIRVLVTIFGGVVGMAVIGLFSQERWAYMVVGSVPHLQAEVGRQTVIFFDPGVPELAPKRFRRALRRIDGGVFFRS